MSHTSFPFPQDSNTKTPPLCALNSNPYPTQDGVYTPTVKFNVDSPIYMPQPYARTRYPSSTSGASFNAPYPPGQKQPSYPCYLKPQANQQFSQKTSNPSCLRYPALGHSSHPSTQKSACTTSSPAYPSYPSSGLSKYPKQRHAHPQSSHHSSHQLSNTGQAVVKTTPTVVPAHPFDPHRDAEKLRKAMKGLANEKAIIKVLTRRSNAQRLEIAVHFKTLYGKDLIKELKNELSGNFKKTIIALMTPLPQFYAKELHDAISGLGTDETVLIEVLCSLTNAEVRTIREAYHRTYDSYLESDLKGDTSGHFRRLMVSLCSAVRDENVVTNPTAAVADARALYNAGEKRLRTDESMFNMVLCHRNHAQLRLVFQEYQRLTGHDIEKAIKKFSSDNQNGYLAVIRAIKNQQAFFAKCLNKSLKGLRTNDKDLIRLVVTRSEVDMGDIRRDYAANYGESLVDAIKDDTSGDYKKCLLALIGKA